MDGRKLDGQFRDGFVKEMPCDFCSPGLQGLGLSEGKEQIWVKGTDVGKSCKESEVEKQKGEVTGKKRQEVFSGRKLAMKKQARTSRAMGSLGHFQVLTVAQRTAGRIRGLKKVVLCSTQLTSWLWLKLFGCRVMLWKGLFHEGFRVKSLANLP